MGESKEELAPNRARQTDLSALVGILAVVEGALAVGDVSQDLLAAIRKRLTGTGLLGEEAGLREVRQAINDLNHRLRYALGEYASPPESVPVPD